MFVKYGDVFKRTTGSNQNCSFEIFKPHRTTFIVILGIVPRAGLSDLSNTTSRADSIPNPCISADGEIKNEYELQFKLQKKEMKRHREKERLASEACIRKLEEEEEQRKMLQLAQDQLYARTLEKQEIESAKERRVRTTRMKLNNQIKSKAISKPPAKTKISADKKQNVAFIPKNRSERYMITNLKLGSICVQQESPEIVAPPKPVPTLHNAVTRVVTHHSRLNQPNNSNYIAPDELIGSSSKIYGQQSEEELHVPSDVLSNKKKKLEVCITTVNVEDEERIGSAESAGSHDSMNQEFHHFKPIKALPRTPFKTADGKQSEPKLIKVLPIKRVCNDVPKSPDRKSRKKIFGCALSAFIKIARRQVLLKDSQNQQQEIRKTEQRKVEQSLQIIQKSEIDHNTDSNSVVSFDSNKNYTKNPSNKVVNGTNFNTNEQPAENAKQTNKRGKVRNGLILSVLKKKEPHPEKEIEVVQIDDDDEDENVEIDVTDGPNRQRTPDPLGPSPNKLDSDSRPPSYLFEFEPIENIAERIKRRKAAGTDNMQSAVDMVKPLNLSMKANSKKPSAKGRKPKAKAKRRKFSEDLESSGEEFMEEEKTPKPVPEPVNNVEQKPVKQSVEAPESENAKGQLSSPSPRKRPRKNAHPSKKQKPKSKKQEASPLKPAKTKTKTTVETTVASQIKRLARAKKSSKRRKFSESSDSSGEEFFVKQKTPKPVTEPVNNVEQKPVKQSVEAPEPEKPNAKLSSPSPRKRPRKNAHPSKKQTPTVLALSPEPSINLEDDSFVKEQERLERLAEQERKDRELAEQLQARFNAMQRVAGRTRRGIACLPEPSSPPPVTVIEQPKRPPQKRPIVK